MRYNVQLTGTRFIGVDLAWREGSADLVANETGVAVIDADGRVLDAAWRAEASSRPSPGWTAQPQTAMLSCSSTRRSWVRNETGQRLCEKQVGQRYWALEGQCQYDEHRSPRLAGVQFLRVAGPSGWRYSDGSGGPPRAGRIISETYPYATLVGAAELGYDTERPRLGRASRGAFGPLSGGPSALLPATR